jgi:transcriptional regulator with XRE-family HTH domain
VKGECYMLNVKQIAEKAASEFHWSLRDDPTAWSLGAVTPVEVVQKCNEVARENVQSALSRALGKLSEFIATEMDVAISEDGPLADLHSVLSKHVEGLDAELSRVRAAADWQARVDALREAFATAIQNNCPVPALRIADILAYAYTDDRLRSPRLREGLAMLIQDEPVEADWDDEPAPAATPVRQRKAAEPSGPVPALIKLAISAGFLDSEMADILGLSKSYYSLIRNGKRPWPGMKPNQVKLLKTEVNARAGALAKIDAVLDAGAVLKPDGV